MALFSDDRIMDAWMALDAALQQLGQPYKGITADASARDKMRALVAKFSALLHAIATDAPDTGDAKLDESLGCMLVMTVTTLAPLAVAFGKGFQKAAEQRDKN